MFVDVAEAATTGDAATAALHVFDTDDADAPVLPLEEADAPVWPVLREGAN